jgi:hypothetical protein
MGFKRSQVQVLSPRQNSQVIRMSLSDKRKTVRVKQHLSVLYPHTASNMQQWHMASVYDISEIGLSIITHVRFAAHTRVEILLRAPFKPVHWLEIGTRVVGCQARVEDLPGGKKTQAYHVHLKFTNLSAAYRELLRVYIAWVLSRKLKVRR